MLPRGPCCINMARQILRLQDRPLPYSLLHYLLTYLLTTLWWRIQPRGTSDLHHNTTPPRPVLCHSSPFPAAEPCSSNVVMGLLAPSAPWSAGWSWCRRGRFPDTPSRPVLVHAADVSQPLESSPPEFIYHTWRGEESMDFCIGPYFLHCLPYLYHNIGETTGRRTHNEKKMSHI